MKTYISLNQPIGCDTVCNKIKSLIQKAFQENAGKIEGLVMVISIEIPQDEQKTPNIEYHPNNSV